MPVLSCLQPWSRCDLGDNRCDLNLNRRFLEVHEFLLQFLFAGSLCRRDLLSQGCDLQGPLCLSTRTLLCFERPLFSRGLFALLAVECRDTFSDHIKSPLQRIDNLVFFSEHGSLGRVEWRLQTLEPCFRFLDR